MQLKKKMADKGEMLNLQRDMSYMKHQLACVMQALKITPCGCHDCLYTPSLISSTNEVFVGFDYDPKETSNCSKSPPNVITPPSSRDDSAPKQEQNVNLFDDVMQVNGSSSGTLNSPEHNYVCSSNEHNYGKAKPTEATAQCVPTNVMSLKNVPNVASPGLLIPKKEISSKKDTSPKKTGKETRGRKRKVWTLDAAHSPMKYDKRGRRFYSKEQKKAIYDTYLVKGLQETAKEFGSSMTAIYNHIHRHKMQLADEEAKLKSAKRLRTSLVAKAAQNFRTKRQRRPTVKKMEEDLAPSTPVKQISSLKRGMKMSPSGRRYYSPEMKKSIYNYYLTHGRVATMKHFSMTPGIFTYLMYHKTHVALRQSVKAAMAKKIKMNETSDQEEINQDEADEEKNVAKKSKKDFAKEEVNGEDISEDKSSQETKDFQSENAGVGCLVPKIENEMETEQDTTGDYETENSSFESGSTIGSIEYGGKMYKGRKKILTDEQEQQLYQVLRTLEQQGTRITPNLLAYAAKQIIKRSADVDPNNIRISYSYAMVSLKRYRDQKV